ncbi:MAG: hypothetical protein E7591_00970 [Ruminococcaceae bacterium]|nr:hypothetical protein [Oscillospiraceae bacterium]
MKRLNTVLWGILLVLVGVVLSLNALDFIDIRFFFDGWWTLIIIAPCAIGLITSENKTSNLIGLFAGIVLLLCCRGIIRLSMVAKLIVPIIIIIIGLRMIFGSALKNKGADVMASKTARGYSPVNVAGVFSSQTLNLVSEEFHMAELNAIFGSAKLDLRGSSIPEDAVINACAVFGGVEILLPENSKVKVRSNSIFGGVSKNKKRPVTSEESVTVYINGTCMFGGVDIR